jgi:hypothetical protein
MKYLNLYKYETVTARAKRKIRYKMEFEANKEYWLELK